MLLERLSAFTIEESRLFCDDMVMLEDGEGPRWKFDYSNFKTDPNPDVLLLGAYTHPNTGNNLVGGINLRYLNSDELDKLAQMLPKLMAGRNLYDRYHIGRRILPSIFRKFYRTYNSAYIHGVKQGILYPKFGMVKTVANWLKKKIGGITKTKAQRQQEAQPKYPDDLSRMRDRLDQAVQQLQIRPPKAVPPETPEMQAARDAFRQYRKDQQQDITDVEKTEDIPLNIAQKDFDQAQQQQAGAEVPNIPARVATPETEQPEVPTIAQPQEAPSLEKTPSAPEVRSEVPDAQYLPAAEPELPDTDTEQGQIEAQKQFEKEKQKNKEELLDPDNEIDLSESLIYYSPLLGRYVVEPGFKLSHHWKPIIKEQNYSLYANLERIRPKLVKAAQAVYDGWEQHELSEYGESGGICDAIANAMGGVLNNYGIEFTEGGHEGDDHAYLIAFDADESYIIDIPERLYEQGGGYNWTKVNGAQFTVDDIQIIRTARPDWIDEIYNDEKIRRISII